MLELHWNAFSCELAPGFSELFILSRWVFLHAIAVAIFLHFHS
jgi:hypothetical protein